MSKKIVVLTGSPRRGGNSFAMTDAFIRQAQAKGHTVTRFDAAFMKVEGCRACEQCYSQGKPCVFEDDFEKIAPAILEADLVVFTTPVYWYTLPAQLKAVVDKLYALCVGQKPVSGKQYALLACCEEEDPTVLEGVSRPLARTAALLGWSCAGEVLVPGVLKVGEIEKTDGCSRAAALADSL